MANYGEGTKHTRHIARRMHFVRNGEKCKIHKIYWYEGGLQLADIGTKNVSEPDLTPRMKYILVITEMHISYLLSKTIKGASKGSSFDCLG